RAATSALAAARRHANRAGRLAATRVEDAAAALSADRTGRDDIRADLRRALGEAPEDVVVTLRL
ncbi:MAG: hypothetical protein SF182_25325, partial [Deltaproteobacteria bacterium]|nr:hypothetical protein [Deltaproteobacteria bacterium]